MVGTVFSTCWATAIIVSETDRAKHLQGEKVGSNRPLPSRGDAPSIAARSADRYFELKSQIHRKLIGVLNLDRVASIPKDRVRMEIGRVVERLLEEERVPMTTAEPHWHLDRSAHTKVRSPTLVRSSGQVM